MSYTRSQLALGLAALGRPAYITLGHAQDVEGGYDASALEERCHAVLDAAFEGGIRWFDAARSYGRAEEFLSHWLRARGSKAGEVTVSSKWGYRYVADWNPRAERHEIKDHSLAALLQQRDESRTLLGEFLSLYQIHSATLESGVLENQEVLSELASMREGGLSIGLSLSGPHQREALERALRVRVRGRPLFDAVQATWNLYERSVEPALRQAKDAGLRVIIKEALANGRLAGRHAPDSLVRRAERSGASSDAVALAAALAQPFTDVVLSGAATPAQLAENLRAYEVDGASAAAALASLVEAPEDYWSTRAKLPWN